MKGKFIIPILIICIMMSIGYINTAAEPTSATVAATTEKVTVPSGVYKGECGKEATYSLDVESGELKVSGKGAMYNMDGEHTRPWTDLAYLIKTITVENGITNVSNSAFAYCMNVTKVTLPESVTSIGIGAFFGCSSLENIKIPESVTDISNSAFAYCTSMSTLSIPSRVTEIPAEMCYGNSKLAKVNISNSVTKIGNYAFFNCYAMEEVTIPETVKSIGLQAFAYYDDTVRPAETTTASATTANGTTAAAENKLYRAGSFKVNGKTGSAAHKYAVENGLKFNSTGVVEGGEDVVFTTTSATTQKKTKGTIVIEDNNGETVIIDRDKQEEEQQTVQNAQTRNKIMAVLIVVAVTAVVIMLISRIDIKKIKERFNKKKK